MIVVIDNYDSFTYNLVQYLGELGAAQVVVRNDQISVDQVAAMQPDAVVIGPGPCTPGEAGISLELIRRLGPTTPILGVCLGHQAIGQAYGGRVVQAPSLMHGKTSRVLHTGQGIFAGLPNPFTAGRYHSLVVDRASLPDELLVTAETEDGLVMAVQHRVHPVYGVQFHPESILTECGRQLLQNFLRLVQPAAA